VYPYTPSTFTNLFTYITCINQLIIEKTPPSESEAMPKKA